MRTCNAATGFQPWALCDLSPEALGRARGLTGLPGESCFTDLDRALRESGADCVIICTPTQFHVPMSLRAIEAGLPVLVEKGMAPDWASARKLVDASLRSGVKVAVAQNYRYFSGPRTLHRALKDTGWDYSTGPVHHLLYVQNRVRPEPKNLSYPFASVWDMSCHHFDNLLYWFGPLASMQAFSWRAPWSAYEHDNNTSAHLVFQNGTAITYQHTHDAARATEEIQAHGERGAFVLRDNAPTFNERPRVNFGQTPVVPVPWEEAHGEADLLRDFHAWLTGGPEPGISVRHNLETMACCEMMVRSLGEGRCVRREELDA